VATTDNSTDENGNELYWAAAPENEIADRILEKKDKYYDALVTSGRFDLYMRSWTKYNQNALTGATLNSSGAQGELTTMYVNHFRNLLLHLETMTRQQRIAYQPMATNSDKKSQSQVILATGILDYYLVHKDLETTINLALKEALIYGEAFGAVSWDVFAGETYGLNAIGLPQYQGDIKYSNYNPLSCIRNLEKDKPNKDDWFILRDFENKYDLSANAPEHIKKSILDDSDDLLEMARSTVISFIDLEDSDLVAVYTLVHKRTPSLPEGRFVRVLENGTVLVHGPLPYKTPNIYRLSPDEMTGTILGYTVAFDLLPIQEGIDALYNAAISNNVNFATQNILVPKGHDTSTTQLSGGLNLVEYDPKVGKPEPLNLTLTSPETYRFMEMLEELGQVISGVNSVARGNPEASLKSGAALALVQSQAIQFTMTLQNSYIKFAENLGNGTIEITQDFADTPRIAEIVGKSNQPIVHEYKGSDISGIKRVSVETVNPAFRTTAGKVNMADLFLEKGLIVNQDQYVQTVNTGRFDLLIQGKQMQLLLIKGENEALAKGEKQTAIVYDNHLQHIQEHQINTATPQARYDRNDPSLAVTLEHIQEHINFLISPDPNIQNVLKMTGQQSLYVPPMMPGQMPGQPVSPPQPMPQEFVGDTGEALGAEPAVMTEAGQVNIAQMPRPPQNADPRSAEIINGERESMM